MREPALLRLIDAGWDAVTPDGVSGRAYFLAETFPRDTYLKVSRLADAVLDAHEVTSMRAVPLDRTRTSPGGLTPTEPGLLVETAAGTWLLCTHWDDQYNAGLGGAVLGTRQVIEHFMKGR